MEAFTHELTQIFQPNARYMVPLYQRPYVWEEDTHWQPLWDDVVTVAEHQLDAQEGGHAPVAPHFMGAIVLEQQQTPPGGVEMRSVIDGQQRLTTLQLLLGATADAADEHGHDKVARVLRKLVRNDSDLATGDDLFKVWPTNADRHAFCAVMQLGGPPSDHEDDPNNKIDEAYGFFRQAAEQWVTDDGPDEPTEAARFEALRVTLTGLLKVVSINLGTEDNAQVIFETLNGRGTPLLAFDLVKNAALYEAERQKLNVDDLYHEHWRPQFDSDDYWRQERRQGRLNRPRGELFLMHWLTMKLAKPTAATELFPTFRTEMLNGHPPMDPLIQELCADAAVMRGFDNPAGRVEQRFFERLDALDTSTVLPLILLMFRSSELSAGRRQQALRDLESWLVRRMIMRLTTKDYNRAMADLVAAVSRDVGCADEIVKTWLMDPAHTDTRRWPSDDEVLHQLLYHDLYDVLARKRVGMLLWALELDLRDSNKTEDIQAGESLSIEHVMPRAWKEAAWPLPDAVLPEQAAVERAQRLNRLGNLTLITGPLNSSLGNNGWRGKTQELSKHSVLLLNNRLIADHPDGFDDQAVDARTEALAQRIIAIWPRREQPNHDEASP